MIWHFKKTNIVCLLLLLFSGLNYNENNGGHEEMNKNITIEVISQTTYNKI